jgi:hypothetical protein
MDSIHAIWRRLMPVSSGSLAPDRHVAAAARKWLAKVCQTKSTWRTSVPICPAATARQRDSPWTGDRHRVPRTVLLYCSAVLRHRDPLVGWNRLPRS